MWDKGWRVSADSVEAWFFRLNMEKIEAKIAAQIHTKQTPLIRADNCCP